MLSRHRKVPSLVSVFDPYKSNCRTNGKERYNLLTINVLKGNKQQQANQQ